MKLAMIGYGRMGSQIVAQAQEKGHEVVTIDPVNPQADFKELSEESVQGVDVCIDFTSPAVVMDNIKKVSALGKTLVVGTTGWYDKEAEVKALVEKSGIGFIYASNFSLGMNIMFAINNFAADLMNNFSDYDVAGLELHHNQKVDSPSGTAEELANDLKKRIDRKTELTYEYINRKPKPEELHYASVRCGHITGTHTTMYDSPADTIELTHRARNRDGFVLGAIAAAEWVKDKKGFYTVHDMMTSLVGAKK